MPRLGSAASGNKLETKRIFMAGSPPAAGRDIARRDVPVVTEAARISAHAVFRCVDDVDHLAGGDEMEAIALAVVVFSQGALVKTPHRVAQQHHVILRDAAVSVQLDEYPIGPSLHVDAQ